MFLEIIIISLAISTWSFLFRETDFVIHYLELIGEKFWPGWLMVAKFQYENSEGEMGDTFVKFYLLQIIIHDEYNKFQKFFASLLSCHICTNTFFSILLSIILLNPLFFLAPLPAILCGYLLVFLRNKVEA